MSEAVAGARWPAYVACVLLVLLLLLNGYMWKRNQETFVAADRPRVVPRNIESVAKKNNYNVVATTFHMYYALRALQGATVVMPERMKGHQFAYERVTRLDLAWIPDTPVVPLALVERLRETKLVNVTTAIDWATPLEVVVIPGTARYILASTGDEKNWIIIPEWMYRSR
jgi:hypothetical protein